MKNIFKYLLSFLAIAALLTSCLPDPAEEALVYQGPTKVEFKNHTLGMLASILQGKGISTATSYAQGETSRTVIMNERGTDTIFVQLIGPQRSTALDLAFEVDESSTAEEGVHYNFIPNGGRTVTIPANSSVGYILLDIVPNSIPMYLPADSAVTLSLNLIGNSEVEAAENYDSFEVNILQPFQCPNFGADFEGTYTVVYENTTSGAKTTGVSTITVDPNDPKAVYVTNFWNRAGSNPVRVVFDGCEETVKSVTIPQQDFFVHAVYGQAQIQSISSVASTFNEDAGTFTVGFRPTVSAGSFGNYKATFTKQL